jgi:Flp pilus assembly protein TadB
MALSMDEQRMLAEIERRLAAEDPGLATRLSSFRRPGPSAAGLRNPRGRLIMLACMITLIAIVSAVIYMLVPFRPQHLKAPSAPLSPHQTSAFSGQVSTGTSN